jgi:hypothetical protein
MAHLCVQYPCHTVDRVAAGAGSSAADCNPPHQCVSLCFVYQLAPLASLITLVHTGAGDTPGRRCFGGSNKALASAYRAGLFRQGLCRLCPAVGEQVVVNQWLQVSLLGHTWSRIYVWRVQRPASPVRWVSATKGGSCARLRGTVASTREEPLSPASAAFVPVLPDAASVASQPPRARRTTERPKAQQRRRIQRHSSRQQDPAGRSRAAAAAAAAAAAILCAGQFYLYKLGNRSLVLHAKMS